MAAAFTTLITFEQCSTPEIGEPVNQGIITYEVTYPELDSNNVLTKFLPDEMVMTFKGDKYKHEWVAGMGLFKTGYVADRDKGEMDYILKLINVKYHSIFKKDEGLVKLNEFFPPHKVKFSKETRIIAGYTCHEAVLEFEDPKLEPQSVWYTKVLPIKDPNWCLPISTVPHLMFEYAITKYGLTMKFTAKEVHEEEITDEAFIIPNDYEEISNNRMQYKLKETFMNFQY